jgi:hypothetical protein
LWCKLRRCWDMQTWQNWQVSCASGAAHHSSWTQAGAAPLAQSVQDLCRGTNYSSYGDCLRKGRV